MERWGIEEITHGEVINRFLNEVGYRNRRKMAGPGPQRRLESLQSEGLFLSALTNLVGKQFHGDAYDVRGDPRDGGRSRLPAADRAG